MEIIKQYWSQILVVIGIIGGVIKWITGRKKENVEVSKTAAEISNIYADSKKGLSDQLDTAWENNFTLRETIKTLTEALLKCTQEIEHQAQEILALKRKINLYAVYDTIIEQKKEDDLNNTK